MISNPKHAIHAKETNFPYTATSTWEATSP